MPRFSLEREVTIEAAHRLPRASNSPKCERLHGHSYTIRARWTVGGSAHAGAGHLLNSEGMVIDFALLKALLAEVHDLFDHRFINEVELPPLRALPEFLGFNLPCGTVGDTHGLRRGHHASTAENLALWVAEYLQQRTMESLTCAPGCSSLRLAALTVRETANNIVTLEL